MEKSAYSVRILVYTCLAHTLTHLYIDIFPPILTHIGRDFSLELDQVGFYVTLCGVFFGVGAIPAGWLGDRFGERFALGIFFAGCAAGGLVLGLAPTPWVLGAGAVMLGLATSIFHPVGNALISKGCERRGRALGINGIAGSIGTALGPMVAGGIADWSSWRWLFVGLAVPSAVLAVGLLFTDLGPAASPASHPPAPAAGRESPQDGRGRNGIVLLFVLLLVAMVCGGFYFKLATTALPYQLSEHGVLSERMGPGALKAGLALSFGAIGQFLAGWLCDRRAETWLYVANLGLLFPCFYLLSTLQGQTALWPTAAAASILMFGVQPIENSALARFTPPRWRGRVYGVKFILVFGLGGFGSWLATGILKTSGAPAVFEVSAVLALAAFALALVAAAVSRKTADF